ncbi:D-alanyl-D-alanine carboxypeptidase family protein [Patescibacteria group bacterium]|nr:D-alanyl-D-alanine carboxypeptidase family protein [Patescibacteria group bacterium]
MLIDSEKKEIIDSILNKLEKEKTVLISFKNFYGLLEKNEVELCRKFLKINPRKYGFKGKYFGIKSVPKKLIEIKGQKYIENEKIKNIATQYLSGRVYKLFIKLNKGLQKDLNRKLLIDSCYRSPAYQLFTFFYYLKFLNWNFRNTIKRVALPGYSEHGDPFNPAIDFITRDGKPSDKKPLDFLETKEYEWLLKNADKFGFYLSYSKKNKYGIMFEPWHWRLK